MNKGSSIFVALVLAGLSASQALGQELVLDDSLRGSTIGARSGGSFVSGGWKVTGKDDFIYWHIPTLTQGAVEWSVAGLRPNDSRPEGADKNEIFHMYDWTYGNADTVYDGYRNNPYKHFVRKSNVLNPGKVDSLELVWKILAEVTEPDTQILSWDPALTYRFRQEWGPDGAGNSVMRTYRDGVLIMTMAVPGTWNPSGHAVRIAASSRAPLYPDFGAPLDAVFSDVKVWDLTGAPPPPPPPSPGGRSGPVRIVGNSLVDDGGPFLGLGWTYMTALWQTKYNRAQLRSDLAFMKQNGFNYLRALGQVAGDSWSGLEIAPVDCRNQNGAFIPAWPDYVQQLRDLLDIAWDEYGIRTQITIFGGADTIVGGSSARQQVVDMTLQAVAGREHKVILIEVANEGWHTGFPDSAGLQEMQSFARYLDDRTTVPVAITSAHGVNTIEEVYAGQAADIATWHFSRDPGPDGGWLPVYDSWQVEEVPGIPPVSSNEPIGPGSSVASENDPIKLVMAAAFAYVAKLPMYVFHSNAGVRHLTRFEDMSGVMDYVYLASILPPDVANWARNDGKQAASPFTFFASGQPDRWWPEVGGSDGAVRTPCTRKSNEFVCAPIGILSGGLELEAREGLSFSVYDPLTGTVVDQRSMTPGQRFRLPQGPGAYVITNAVVSPPLPPGSGGLTGEYYDNLDFTQLTLTRTDATVNFDWGTGSPAPGIGPDTFSIRWTGQVAPRYSETYTFYTQSDDGVRLWVNGQLLIDNWTDHSLVEDQGTITLAAGQRYDLRLEYYENGGGAAIKLLWSSPSQPKQVIPPGQLYPASAPPPPPGGTNAAQVVALSVPTSIVAGQTDTVSVTMQNTGTSTWTAAGGYKLGSQNPQDNVIWGANRVYLGASESIGPGQSKTFRFTVTAPSTPATYNLQWRMVHEGVEWFGDFTPNAAVTVTAAVPPGTGTGLTGQYFDNMDFSGLALTRTDATVNFDWGTGAPAPGMGSDTFSVRWTGQVEPRYSEPYTFYTQSDDGVRLWVNGQLLIDNWTDHSLTENGGTLTLVAGQRYDLKLEYYENGVSAVVKLLWSSPHQAREVIPQSQLYPAPAPPPPPGGSNAAQFVSQSVPTSMAAGQTYAVSLTMQNTGTSIWTAAGGYKLGSQNPQDNGTWGTGRVDLAPGEVVGPNQSKTFQFTVTAPATPGVYAFQWRMVQELVEWFGEFTAYAAVTVGDVGAEASPFGVVSAAGIGNDIRRLDDLHALGVGWIRVSFEWPSMEPAKGNLQWDLADRIVNEISARGVHIYWDFSYAPCWANGRPQAPTGDCLDPDDQHYPPLNQQDLFDFVYAVVSRYKDRVRYWGHWNEVNLDQFYRGGVDGFVANELPTTINAIKAADPTAKVVVGELSSSGDEFPHLKKILDAARGRFDVVSHHVYDGGDTCQGRLAETIDPLRDNLVAWGYASVPVWVTETGLKDSETLKSAYLTCFYDGMKSRPWWAKTFWYRYEFEGTPGSSWGLLDGGPDQYTPNQTYFTYQNYILGSQTNAAAFVFQTVPTVMVAGQSYTVSVTIQNTGTSTWTQASEYKLGSQNPGDNTLWRDGRVNLASDEAIGPGQTKTFQFTVKAPTTPGTYNFQWRMLREHVEWFGDFTPNIAVRVTGIASPPGTGSGLTAQYYDNMDFTGLKLTRTDATVNFDWGSGAPAAGIGADTFSVRWIGQVEARYSESYTFYTQSDDGVRLWVNGQLLIDNWTDHSLTENSGTITLVAGQRYDISLEYYENGGLAVIKLLWASFSLPKEVIPQSQLYPSSVPSEGAFRVGDTFTIGSNAIRHTDAAFDQANDVYFVVFGRGPTRGRFVSSAGVPLGPAEFKIHETDAYTQAPRVAYSPDAGGFLVTWLDTRSNPELATVWGRLVAFRSDGTPTFLSGDFQIAEVEGAYPETAPAVAYSTGSREFLVAWMRDADIRGRRVSFNGSLLGGEIPISSNVDWQNQPSIAYDPYRSEFYVAYADASGLANILGRRVKAGTGELLGGEDTLDSGSFLSIPEVQFDPLRRRFLVVWYNASPPPPTFYGRFIDSGGGVAGAKFTVATGYSSYDALGLAYNPVSDSYFAVFHGLGAEDAGVEISGDGVPGGVIDATATGATLGNFNPRVASHAAIKEWLVVTVKNFSEAVGQRIQSKSDAGGTPAPAVTAIAPKSGPTAGGTPVSLSGTNFVAGATVTLGGVAATSVVVASATSLTAITGAHAAGAVDVVVRNPDGQASTLAAGFTYVAPPLVTGISPASGPTGGGTAITITGSNFMSGATVSLGGGAATSVAVASATSLTAVTGAHAAGAVDVVVRNPDGQASTLAGGFTYVAPPLVTGITPASGPTAGGTPVSLSGSNFVAGATVTLGGGAATSVVVASATSLTAITGAHAAGAVDVVVRNPDGQASTLAAGFTYVAPPLVTGIAPASGPAGGGTAITIMGSNFTSGATVTLGGVAATSVVVASATSLTAITGAHAAGAVDVVMRNPDGQASTLATGFTYVANAAQFVSQSVPTSMVAGQSYAVSVTMQNTGTSTWTAAGGYKLGTQNPQDNTVWTGGTRIYLAPGETIGPTQSKTFTFTVTAPATAGTYNFQWRMVRELVEWFGEFTPNLTITVTAPPPGTGTGLSGEYFDNVDFTALKLTRTDATVNFDWGTGSPDPAIGPDTFSVRWTGQVQPRYSETYTFYTQSDDGVRLWVNGQLLIDNWTDHSLTENSGTLTLAAGQRYDLKLEYYENGGFAAAKLLWSSFSQAKEIIPQSRLYPAPIQPLGTGTGLSGEYFDNMDFTALRLTRTDATVNFDWGTGSPDPAIGPDTFSVRWTGQVQPRYSETYTFYTQSDDGVRLWVNGQLLINNWTDHGLVENSGTITLVAGQRYDLRLEYYENGGGAAIKLLWSSPRQAREIIPRSQLYPASLPGTGTGLTGQYFDNMDFTALRLTRTDATVNFDWGTGSPDPAIGPDTFSVRWTGQVQPRYSETYTFYTQSDDGVRLWVNGQLLIDNWTDHGLTENSGTLALAAGQRYDLRLEYYENGGGAAIKLLWSSPRQARETIPQSQLYP